jgi:hypothetical protein
MRHRQPYQRKLQFDRKPKLAQANPTGRLDVAAYRMAERLMGHLEKHSGIIGLCEHLLPMVESAIVDTLPGRSVIPPEVHEDMRRLWVLYEQNRGRV